MVTVAARSNAAAPAYRLLGSATRPDISRMLPPIELFNSASKSGFINCGKLEAVTVLGEVWSQTRSSPDLSKHQSTIENICKKYNFSPSDFTSLAILLKKTGGPEANRYVIADLLSLAESQGEPGAIIRAAKSKIESSRTLAILESTAIWKRLVALASTKNIPEAWELIAETYSAQKMDPKADEAWGKAAEAGSGKACFILGKKASQSAKKESQEKAVEWFKMAAERDEAEAYYELGLLLEKQDPEKAEHNFLVAASSGIQRAAEVLQDSYAKQNKLMLSEEWKKVSNSMNDV